MTTTTSTPAVTAMSAVDTVRTDPTRYAERSLLKPACADSSATPSAKPADSTTPITLFSSAPGRDHSHATSSTSSSTLLMKPPSGDLVASR